MRKSKFSDEKMVRILREADRGQVSDVAKKHGISDQTSYIWRKRFGAMTPDDAKRLKMLAERLLEIDVLKEINSKKW